MSVLYPCWLLLCPLFITLPPHEGDGVVNGDHIFVSKVSQVRV